MFCTNHSKNFSIYTLLRSRYNIMIWGPDPVLSRHLKASLGKMLVVSSQSDQKWRFLAKKCYKFWLLSRQFSKVFGYFSSKSVGYSSARILILAFIGTFWATSGNTIWQLSQQQHYQFDRVAMTNDLAHWTSLDLTYLTDLTTLRQFNGRLMACFRH